MNKLVASVGMAAIGVTGLQTASAQGLISPAADRPWSLSATVRGFYDDNRDTLPDNFSAPGYKRETFGFELAPSARINLLRGQTALSAGYTYSYKYYDEKSWWDTQHDSQSHDFNLALNHAFSPLYRIAAKDSFVIGQEPDQLRSGNSFTTFQRIPGDNIRNEGNITFGADLTPKFGVEIGYSNGYVDYEDDSSVNIPSLLVAQPSLSGLLDRMVQTINLDGRWTLSPSTVGVLGYAFSDTDYLRDEVLGYRADNFAPIMSDSRNNRSHYVYVGADHTFSPDLSGSVRVGARLTDYYNDGGSDEVSPYAKASLRYAYLPTGSVEIGGSYDRTATDVLGLGGSGFVRDQEAGTLFASVRQEILPKLVGTLTGQFQNSTFNGGGIYDNKSEQFYLVGVNLEYSFNRFLAAHVGYNYDLLESDISARGFDRNRVYVGLTATY